MSFAQELASWKTPPKVAVATAPVNGTKAPSSQKLRIPSQDSRPIVVTFLRHCGCPFAEASFIHLRERAAEHPDISFIAVSHSVQSHTETWLSEVGGAGTTNPITLIIDEDREIYGAWGLGTSSLLHVLSPAGLYAVYSLAQAKGIKNRPTESGSRWQTSGSFAVDSQGMVRWGGVAQRADTVPDFRDAVAAVKSSSNATESAKL